jgi:isoamylase
MTNVWGYSHLSFFAPMSRLSEAVAEGGPPQSAAHEFKDMVKALHAHGIQVRRGWVVGCVREKRAVGATT